MIINVIECVWLKLKGDFKKEIDKNEIISNINKMKNEMDSNLKTLSNDIKHQMPMYKHENKINNENKNTSKL